MGWIVGITTERSNLRVIELTEEGERVMPLADVPLHLSGSNPNTAQGDYTEFAFSALEPCDDAEVFDRLGIPVGVRSCQTIFRYRQGPNAFYVPAQVLVGALFCRNSLTREYALTPTGFQMLGMLVEGPEGKLNVELPRKLPKGLARFTQNFRNTLLWTISFPDARRAVASIFNFALKGRFDLRLPSGRISASFPGKRVGDEVLVQNMLVEWVQSDGPPVAGLEGRVSQRIVLRERAEGAEPSTEEGLVLGDKGWHLSDDEWLVISAILMSTMKEHALKRRGLGKNPRGKMELLLRKLSEGVAWAKLGETPNVGANICSFFVELRRDGRWERIKAYLAEFRAHGR
jgi:transposase